MQYYEINEINKYDDKWDFHTVIWTVHSEIM